MSSSTSPSKSNLLPEIALQHHGKTIFGPMKEWQNRSQIPPVLLLTGQPGIGKRLVAYFLAHWALCEKSHSELKPCGECPSCLKNLTGNGVDLTEVVSDLEDGSGTLKIEQFRKLKTTMGFSAHEGRYKIVLIPHADRMTLQASNSVLKLLEETPPGWIFFLTANDPTLLLPTLVSRCQMLRLKPFSSDELQELLKAAGIEPQRRKTCAEISQGSWDRALSFADDKTWEQRDVLFQFLKEPSSVVQSLVDWGSQEPSHFDILIDLLEQLTADLIRWTATPGRPSPDHYAWTHIDGKNCISTHAQQVVHHLGGVEMARAFWIARAESIAKARQVSLAPLNRKLLIQDVLLPWIGAYQ